MNSSTEKAKCRCGLEAALKVSSNGRKYLGCPRRVASGQCEFTRMLPDNAREGTSRPITQSQNEIDPNVTAQSTAKSGPANPIKRPAVEDEDEELSPSQKRAKIIEAVLRESLQDTLSASQQRTTPIDEVLSASNSHTHSENNAHPTALPNPSPMHSGDDSNTNTSYRTDSKYQEVRAEGIASQHVISSELVDSKIGSSSLEGAPSSRAVDADKTWLLHTPKRTEFGRSASMTSVLSSPEPSPVHTYQGPYRANEEWHKGNSVVNISDEPSARMRYSAVSVTHNLEALSGLPSYLRTLEKSHEIKDMKIKHLENEVQRLKNKQEELEKLLQMYENHSPIINPGV